MSRGGRRPILLEFKSDLRHYLVFEMGRTGFRIAVSDLKGRIVGKDEDVFQIRSNIKDRCVLLKDRIFKLLRKTGIGLDNILKIQCISAGIYVEKGKALKWSPTCQKADGLDVYEYFCRAFRREIIMNHSVKLSLLGEKVAGKAKGCGNVVYVDFAYGLGCAIMIDGNIYFGEQSSAGEIGYFYSSLDEFLGSSIQPYEMGCLENRISGKALQENARKELQAGRGGRIAELTGKRPDSVSGETVFTAYKDGDPQAEKILKEAFTYFNMALCNIINLLAPELVILGGGFSHTGDVLIELVSNEIPHRVLQMPRLEVSELKSEACLIGAVQYLIDHTDLLAEL
jgi:predicted NBD/HSP70 family sugar kinase